jgi:choice-of-anchor B domain-containing protein
MRLTYLNTLLISFLLMSFTSIGQINFNLEKIGELSYDESISDIWGYVDENGAEYAIMGTRTGTAIIELDGPDAPREILFIPGNSSTWRDMKSVGDRVYVTTDTGQDGLLIINMSQVEEDSISYHFWRPDLVLDSNNIGTLNKCHNIYADDNGYAYLAGCNVYDGGVLIFDLITNPDTPRLVGASERIYAHDCFVRDDVLFTSDIYTGNVSLYDVSDKTDPQLLGRQNTTGSFTHNAWSSDDNNYVFTTDEIVGGFVDAYDISDPGNIKRLDAWQPDNAFMEGIVPHNTHYYDGYLVTSWYIEGGIVLDASQPDNLVLVAQYDTYTGQATRFNGAWGAYPYLPSGRLLISDINSGLIVFQPNYVRAARLEGLVTSMKTGDALSNVEVKIHDTLRTTEQSAGNGLYKTGTAHFGEHVVSYSKAGYITHYDTLTFSEGDNIMNDVELKLAQNYEWRITVLDSSNQEGIENVQVKLVASSGPEFERSTDSSGQVIHPQITEGSYTVYIGKWAYKEIMLEDVLLDSDQSDTFYIAEGYRDYFNLDLGWTSSTDSATSGFWTRAIPLGTAFESRISNPGFDSQNDFGDYAFITGNDGAGGAGSDDIDGGNVILNSPWFDLSDYEDPTVSFDYWFFTDGGNTEPDDSMVILLQSPTMEDKLVTFENSRSEWTTYSFKLMEVWEGDLDSLRLTLIVGDNGDGHLVEAGIDAFNIMDDAPTFASNKEIRKISIYPNPATQYLFLSSEQFNELSNAQVRIINVEGKVLEVTQLNSNEIYIGHLNPGNYWLDIQSDQAQYNAQFSIMRP